MIKRGMKAILGTRLDYNVRHISCDPTDRYPYKAFFCCRESIMNDNDLVEFRGSLIAWGNNNCDKLFFIQGFCMNFEEESDLLLCKLTFL